MIFIDKNLFDGQRIEKVYKDYIQKDLQKNIEKELEKENEVPLIDAHKIVISFLKEHFLDDNCTISPDKVSRYLFDNTLLDPQMYLESIILSFWKCIIRLWVEKLRSMMPGESIPCLTDSEITALSKWEATKKHAQEQSDPEKRIELIKSVITDRTYYLFSDITKADIFNWSVSSDSEISDEKLEKIDILPVLRKDVYGTDKKKTASPTIAQDKGALEILESIFNYGKLNRELAKGSPRHQLLSAMNVPVCPYCNRQYITLYTDSTSKKTTADLDHFYIKSRYPYLALSLYNFIPSCQICNSRFKGTTDFYLYPHVYPYTQEFGGDARFTVKLDPSLLDDMSNWKDIKMIELANKSGREHIENSIATFSLTEVYQSHIDYVQEIWFKSKMYNTEMIEMLSKEYSQLFDTERSIMDLLFGQYLDNSKLHNRPLSKLTRDILTECYGDQIDWK